MSSVDSVSLPSPRLSATGARAQHSALTYLSPFGTSLSGYTPDNLRRQIKHIKENLASPDLPFGVDLLIPAAGGSKTASGGTARKTNYD